MEHAGSLSCYKIVNDVVENSITTPRQQKPPSHTPSSQPSRLVESQYQTTPLEFLILHPVYSFGTLISQCLLEKPHIT